MNRSRRILLLVLLLSALGAILVPSPRAAKSPWDKLRTLKPGQPIHVHLKNGKIYKGEFQSVNDEGITLRQAAGERTLARHDIDSIWRKGKNHLRRNMIIGAALGACFLALPVQLANNRNGWWQNSTWVWLLLPGAGAGLGAAAGNTGWREIYSAH